MSSPSMPKRRSQVLPEASVEAHEQDSEAVGCEPLGVTDGQHRLA